MVDTVKEISVLLSQMPVGGEGLTSVQDIRDLLVTLAPKYAELSDTTDQVIADINTGQIVTFSTEDKLEGFTHSGGEIIASEKMEGIAVSLSLELTSGSGTSTLTVWIQRDSGSGFVNVVRSAENEVLPSNGGDVLELQRPLFDIEAGHRLRFIISGTSANIVVKTSAAAGEIPAIPSASLSIHKL